MGKTANCIKMLTILSDGQIHKTSELARALETEPRNIIEYKWELEMAGYFIESTTGRYGGYRLDVDKCFPSLKLTKKEIKALKDVKELVNSIDNSVNKTDLDLAIGKILCNNK